MKCRLLTKAHVLLAPHPGAHPLLKARAQYRSPLVIVAVAGNMQLTRGLPSGFTTSMDACA
eukprot:2015701-Amphidinium_carterae.1